METSRTKLTEISDSSTNLSETHVYFRRWIVLLTFSIISFLSAFNWIEHNIIQDVTTAFYNASLPSDLTEQQSAVNWFSMIYFITYAPLFIPAMYFLDRFGLKLTLILGI